jgi:hypothetical protein
MGTILISGMRARIRNLDELSCVEERAKEKLEKPIKKEKGDCHDYAKRAV